ncbi:MAG: sigma-54 dependent transcriptional regulator [bacterium]
MSESSSVLPARILVVDDDRAFRLSTAALLREDGYTADAVGDGPAAVDALRTAEYDLMIVDLRMPGIDGISLVEALRLWGNGIPVLMISGFGTVDNAVRALHLGVDDFLTKPVEPSHLSTRVGELLERRPRQRVDESSPGGLVGRSPVMRELYASIQKVAPTNATVLVTGETGTGKELVARAIHESSPRGQRSLVAVNCAALADGVLESELFGHARGAFTGALRDRVGLFETAHGGTILLDEIGDISLAMQQRLLRVLQERVIVRVGDTRAIPVDVRVVAATHRDLEALVKEGRFREDLLYRLAVFPIAIPPLRDRRGDIPLLVDHAIKRIALDGATPGDRVKLACSPLAMRLLRTFDWPGNVRQLFAVLERASIHADFARIEAQHLPPDLRGDGAPGDGPRYAAGESAAEEREAILTALEHTGGAVGKAAMLLGMGRTTLWRKLRTLERDDP